MKRIICFLVLFLFILSNTAFAANWVYFVRNTSHGSNIYIDSDTVVKNGDSIFFWNLEVFDQPVGSIKKNLWKQEAKLTNPRMLRGLESYAYDSNDKEVERGTAPGEWLKVPPGSFADRLIDLALSYAK